MSETRPSAQAAPFFHIDLGHFDLGHVDLGHIDLGHFDLGHIDLGHFDLGHIDLGHFDLGHIDLGHFDIGVPFDDIATPQATTTTNVAAVTATANRAITTLTQALAQHQAESLARDQMIAQAVNETLQRISHAMSHMASASAQAINDVHARVNTLSHGSGQTPTSS
jgi:hypothetical protein